MNFDELKQQWADEPVQDIHLPLRLDTMQKAQSPIDKVRKNMRNEFFMQILSIAIVGTVPFLGLLSPQVTMLFLVFYTLMLAFTGFYFTKFFMFYRRSYHMEYNSRDNLLWFYYELKLNLELYKALTYILVVLGLSFGFLIGYLAGNSSNFAIPALDAIAQKTGSVWLILNAVVTIFLAFALAEFASSYMYGKHLKHIKKILDELDALPPA